ncbi:glycosyltransferase [Leeuwenhoekiella sp. A2]|uniref:glycosyltransferase family 2 protein n=1 Tax=Leeuwenhoekiella sp. A2 TaxID=3141460 RepID=UPI003A805AA8
MKKSLDSTYYFSIIIPHYNSPDLLQRCIDSIPKDENIEVIIVDDNSDSDTVDFNAFPGKARENVKHIFSKEGKGAGFARNLGLKNANGKWLIFADADDFFENDAFSYFYKYLNQECDIVYFGSSSVNSKTLEPAQRNRHYNNLVNNWVKGETMAEDYLRYGYYVPWGKMIKQELIKNYNIYFDEVPASNDLMFSVLTGHYAKKIMADNFPVYCITVNEGSLTKTPSKKNLRSRFLVAIRHYKFMEEINRPQLRPKLMPQIVYAIKLEPKEFYWYISIVYRNKVNILLGADKWPKKIYNQILGRSKE